MPKRAICQNLIDSYLFSFRCVICDMGNIVIYDSGIGGLSVWRSINRKLVNQDYVYFADNKNFPYGNKTESFLQTVAKDNISFLSNNYDVSCVVLACNTVTAAAIDTLRSQFPKITFIGSEPSIKQALNYTVNNIVVATTELTSHSQRLFSRFNHHNVHFVPFPRLASLIETDASKKEVSDYISQTLTEIDYSYDCIVLGCTHYVLVRDLFKSQAFNCKVFDGNNGVADRVKSLTKKRGQGGCISVVLSSPDDKKYAQISAYIKQHNYT